MTTQIAITVSKDLLAGTYNDVYIKFGDVPAFLLKDKANNFSYGTKNIFIINDYRITKDIASGPFYLYKVSQFIDDDLKIDEILISYRGEIVTRILKNIVLDKKNNNTYYYNPKNEYKNILKNIINTRRPFYVMAHMINDINNVKKVIDSGANMIETDVYFENGLPTRMHHGYPCDFATICGDSTEIKTYLYGIYMLKIKPIGILFDLKLQYLEKKDFYQAGKKLAEYIYDILYNKGSISKPKSIISLSTTDDGDFLDGFRSHPKWNTFLNNNVAFEVSFMSLEGDAQRVADFFKNKGVDKRWYGNGISNFVLYELDRKDLLNAVNIRDTSCKNNSRLDKLWYWTADRELVWGDLIKEGIDAICTNDWEGLLKFIKKEPYNSLVYLATEKDDFFKNTLGYESYKITFKTGDVPYAGTDSNLYLLINGELGSTKIIGPINKWMKGNAFERNSLETVSLIGENVGNINSITIWHDGSYLGSSWYLDYVTIQPGCKNIYNIPVNTWIIGNNNYMTFNVSKDINPYKNIKMYRPMTTLPGV